MSLQATLPRSSRFTPQDTQLEGLQRYSGRGFTVIGFPCNQFGAPEPGTAGDIAWNFEQFVVSPDVRTLRAAGDAVALSLGPTGIAIIPRE